MPHTPSRFLAQPELGAFIRELRQVLGLTQEQLAVKLGVTFPTVNRWENKRATPSPLAIEKIEALLEQARKAGTDLLAEYVAKQT